MDFTDDPRQDSVAAALAEVGDRWTFLILRECFFGVRRFTDLQRNLGAARNILAGRLTKLVEHDILERHPYSDRPPREEYRLTEKGRGLYALTVALMFWADRRIVADPPLSLRHRDDDGAIEQICDAPAAESTSTSTTLATTRTPPIRNARGVGRIAVSGPATTRSAEPRLSRARGSAGVPSALRGSSVGNRLADIASIMACDSSVSRTIPLTL